MKGYWCYSIVNLCITYQFPHPTVLCKVMVVLLCTPYSHIPSTLPAPCLYPRVAVSPLVPLSHLVADPRLPIATPPLTDKASVKVPLRVMSLCQPIRKRRRRKVLYLSSLGGERVPKFSFSFFFPFFCDNQIFFIIKEVMIQLIFLYMIFFVPLRNMHLKFYYLWLQRNIPPPPSRIANKKMFVIHRPKMYLNGCNISLCVKKFMLYLSEICLSLVPL